MFLPCSSFLYVKNAISYFDKSLTHGMKQNADLCYVFEDGQIKDILCFLPKHKIDSVANRYIIFGKNLAKHKFAPDLSETEIYYYSCIEKILKLIIDLEVNSLIQNLSIRQSDKFKNSMLYTSYYHDKLFILYNLVYGKDLKSIFNDRPKAKKSFMFLMQHIVRETLIDPKANDTLALLGMICDNVMLHYPDEKSSIQAFKNSLFLRKLAL